jgi:signal transduction histidine kinase/ActR/RegA family two-component response regulator
MSLKAHNRRADRWLEPGRVTLVALLAAVMLLLVEALAGAGALPLRMDGSAVAVLRLMAVLAALLALAGHLAARKRADTREHELTEMGRRLEMVMEVSQIGLWDVDLQSDRLEWDTRTCQHMGVRGEAGIYTEADWLGAIHPEDRERAGRAGEAAVEQEGRFISDYRVRWPDGQVRHLRDMASFYRDREGRPRIAGLVWDVSADKAREAELECKRREAEAANVAKSNFLAAMSHEIRTPLAGVLGMLDLMLEDPLPEPQADRARTAYASAECLLRLLSDVLDYSRLEVDALELAPAPTDPRALAAGVCDLMMPNAREKALTLSCDVEADVPERVRVDPLRLRQVLTNLVANAIVHTRAGGIEVRVARAGGCLLAIEVTDTGAGIAAADHARIFERFQQADSSSTRSAGGSGLGLAIARELVTLMGGEIGVESEIGKGSTFRFTVAAPAAAEPEPAPAGDAPAGPLRPLKILVAEDNATNQKLIGALLRRDGHRVTLVGDGRSAVSAAGAGRFDVILMDIQMPRVDGLTATREIRALPGGAGRVPIVALTASVLTDDLSRYAEAGMDACLGKPIDVPALRRTLAELDPCRDDYPDGAGESADAAAG